MTASSNFTSCFLAFPGAALIDTSYINMDGWPIMVRLFTLLIKSPARISGRGVVVMLVMGAF
jgi:hypothetical protein